MPAALHMIALGVSSLCLLFSIREVFAGTWWQAVGDALMVAAMAIAVTFPDPGTRIYVGFFLVSLALGEAFLARSRAGAHRHRAVCLLIMGASVVVMSGHGGGASVVHSHAVSMAVVGLIGLVAVATIGVVLRRKLTFSSAGMLVATGLMSVATIAQ